MALENTKRAGRDKGKDYRVKFHLQEPKSSNCEFNAFWTLWDSPMDKGGKKRTTSFSHLLSPFWYPKLFKFACIERNGNSSRVYCQQLLGLR